MLASYYLLCETAVTELLLADLTDDSLRRQRRVQTWKKVGADEKGRSQIPSGSAVGPVTEKCRSLVGQAPRKSGAVAVQQLNSFACVSTLSTVLFNTFPTFVHFVHTM